MLIKAFYTHHPKTRSANLSVHKLHLQFGAALWRSTSRSSASEALDHPSPCQRRTPSGNVAGGLRPPFLAVHGTRRCPPTCGSPRSDLASWKPLRRLYQSCLRRGPGRAWALEWARPILCRSHRSALTCCLEPAHSPLGSSCLSMETLLPHLVTTEVTQASVFMLLLLRPIHGHLKALAAVDQMLKTHL